MDAINEPAYLSDDTSKTAMNSREIGNLLGGLSDDLVVVARAEEMNTSPAKAAWARAAGRARVAYLTWARGGGGDRYSAYRAAADESDAAQDELARRFP